MIFDWVIFDWVELIIFALSTRWMENGISEVKFDWNNMKLSSNEISEVKFQWMLKWNDV